VVRELQRGRVVQVDPIKPIVKASGTKRLNPGYDKLLSSFAFTFNLRRYSEAAAAGMPGAEPTMWPHPPPPHPGAHPRVVPARYCPPRHPKHFESSLLELNGIL